MLVVGWSRSWTVTERCIVGLLLRWKTNKKPYPRNSMVHSVTPDLRSGSNFWNPLLSPKRISETNWDRKFKVGMQPDILSSSGQRIKNWPLRPHLARYSQSEWGALPYYYSLLFTFASYKSRRLLNIWTSLFTTSGSRKIKYKQTI